MTHIRYQQRPIGHEDTVGQVRGGEEGGKGRKNGGGGEGREDRRGERGGGSKERREEGGRREGGEKRSDGERGVCVHVCVYTERQEQQVHQ